MDEGEDDGTTIVLVDFEEWENERERENEREQENGQQWLNEL